MANQGQNSAAAFQAIGFLMVGTGLIALYAAYKGESLRSVLLAYIPGSGTSAPTSLSTAPTTGGSYSDNLNTPAQTSGGNGAIFGVGGPVP